MRNLYCILGFILLLSLSIASDCPKAPSYPGDRRTQTSRLRIAQFNVQFLYDGQGTHSFKCPGKCDWKNQDEATRHISEVAKTIEKFDADIIHLAEVEDCSVLEDVLSQMSNGKEYRPYLIAGSDTFLGQNVALLTRIDPVKDLTRVDARASFPISGSKCGWNKKGSTGLSKNLLTTFEIPHPKGSFTMDLAGLHFIAHPDDKKNCAKREAQSLLLARQVERTFRSDFSIILGDFNDYDDSIPDSLGMTSMSQTTKILKDLGYSAVMAKVDQKDRWSSFWNRHHDGKDCGFNCHSQIDHILYKDAMDTAIEKVFYDHEHKAGRGTFVSDHWAVFVDFDADKLSQMAN